MALIVLHESKDSVVKVADNQEEAIFLLPNLEHYQSLGLVHEITADEKEGIIKGTKRFDVMENDAPVIIDVQSYVSIPDAASMAGIIQKHILKHKELLQVDRVKADADYKQKVENNISVLGLLDPNTFAYPITLPEKFLLENHVPNLITGLQYP